MENPRRGGLVFMTLKQDLIFRVLRFAEKWASPSKWANPEEYNCFEDRDMGEVHEHIKLCEEFGWLEIQDLGGIDKTEYAIRRMTAKGHLELKRRRNVQGRD